ncbi:MAG TPA: hypothetical protein VKE88_03360, partial [Candidatus Nanoarchaeia archaeon]|nr:hypothetical protein [Candidatus Nanoarchaeia archaeon]
MNQENSPQNKRNTNIAIFSVAVLLIFAFTINAMPNAHFYSERFIPCVELLEKDLLYQGQPICGHGPAPLVVGAVIQKIIPQYLQEGTLLLAIIMTMLIAYFMITLANVTDKKLKLTIYLAAFLIIFEISLLKVDTLMACFFMLYSFYLDKTNEKHSVWKNISIGVLQALSILSKTTIAIAYVAYYSYPFALKYLTGQRITKEQQKSRIIQIVSLVILLALVFIK